MKKLITLMAVAGLVLALAPAAQAASIVLMDPTTNDGSFESQLGGGFERGPTTSGVWTFSNDDAGPWDNGGANGYMTDGVCLFVANGGASGTATSSDLLGTDGYNTVRAGDEFTYSYDYRPNGTDQTFKFEIDFGNGKVEIHSVTASSTGSYTNMSGTYTATATDAAGGELHVGLSIEGHSWTDNAQLSVEPAPYAPVITQGTSLSTKTGDEDTTFSWTAAELNATDADTSAGSLTWSVDTNATNGVATVSGTGSNPTTFTYVPDGNYSGGDSEEQVDPDDSEQVQ